MHFVTHHSGPIGAPIRARGIDPLQAGAPLAGVADIPGLGPLTPVETDFGQVPAQALRVRDRLRLRSGRYSPITWIDRLLLDEAFLDRNHEAQPVLVSPGKMGPGAPSMPILLAPGQPLSAGQGYGASFRTARHLLDAGMAHRRPERFLTYVTFGFDAEEEVCAAGLWLRMPPRRAGRHQDDDE